MSETLTITEAEEVISPLWAPLHIATSDAIYCAERFICPCCRVALQQAIPPVWECPNCYFERFSRQGAE
jgi:hypothetical protein